MVNDDFPLHVRHEDGTLRIIVYPPAECMVCKCYSRDVYYRLTTSANGHLFSSGSIFYSEYRRVCDKCHSTTETIVWG
jgi:hypothetical protein